ncbi:MAG: hypothetical protein LBB78_05190 [Spirochaetaceae bacterium]|jgi:chromosome segregation ATPase|nr:hypothetical protein [Spirochaetaceae bacterium]
MDADIVFDTTSGFSETEQREILENIEAITRKDLIAPAPDKRKLEAKKRGGNFPLLVNLGGVLLLAGGVLFLAFFYRQDESELRGGSAALGMTDRKLIREIRRANEARIHEKEREISDILAKLSGVDGDLQALQSSIETKLGEREAELRRQMNQQLDKELDRLINQDLSEAAIAEQMKVFDEQQIVRINTELAAYRKELDAERQAAALGLQKAQEEYRHSLTVLQSERAGILEASRMSEANLKAQLEAKNGEITQQYEQNRADLTAAREELQRLTDEQERAFLVERQMSGFYTVVQDHIRGGTPEKAVETLGLMREFLETPAFQTIRAIQSQKEGHLAAINTLSVAVEGLLLAGPISPAVVPPPASLTEEEIAALVEENAALTQTVADQTKEITAYRSQGTDLTRSIREFEGTISTLRTQSAAQAQTISAQERDLTTLRAQNTAQAQTISAQERDLATLRAQNTAQAQTVSAQERDLATLRAQNTAQAQTVSAQERDLAALRAQNTAQAQTVSTQERDLATLRTQNTAQTRTITEQTQQINTLRSTNTSLFQAMENLQQALDTARQLQENQ